MERFADIGGVGPRRRTPGGPPRLDVRRRGARGWSSPPANESALDDPGRPDGSRGDVSGAWGAPVDPVYALKAISVLPYFLTKPDAAKVVPARYY